MAPAVALLCGVPAVATAVNVSELERCASIADNALRLACYDAAMASTPPEAPKPSTLLAEPPLPTSPSLIEERWAIGVSGHDSRFDLRPHRPSYFLAARYSDAPNQFPTSPTQPPPPQSLNLDSVEAKFQLSFKVKLADFSEVGGAALWAGYTQQSHWQVYNRGTSRPFRETDYEPELMLAMHPDIGAFGWRWRLLVLGLDHQSNGRSEPLSRSWNRLYAQFGIERENFALLFRPWWRIPEDASDDDNPDITRYLGHGDLVGVYQHRGHTFSALARYNVSTSYGALQLGWSFPLQRRVRGYVQAFTGYGESLIDYNVRQSTIGIGVLLADFL